MRTLVNISYCAGHYKGQNPDVAPRLDGPLHARWLLDCVRYWREQPYAIAVSMTAWQGLLNVPAGEERDAMWKVLDSVDYLLGVPENPNHQVGAALCIRQGLECAGKLDFDCMIHTAEDVMPVSTTAVAAMVVAIRQDHDYCGEAWGLSGIELNAQFFACKVDPLAGPWDACRVSTYGCIERYLFELLRGRPVKFMERGLYRSCHDCDVWQQWLLEGK